MQREKSLKYKIVIIRQWFPFPFSFLYKSMWRFDLAMMVYDGTVGYADRGDKMRFDTTRLFMDLARVMP